MFEYIWTILSQIAQESLMPVNLDYDSVFNIFYHLWLQSVEGDDTDDPIDSPSDEDTPVDDDPAEEEPVIYDPIEISENTWVILSPDTQEEWPSFGWEYAGAFDPFNRLWLHHGGHDAANATVQSSAIWTYSIDSGNWEIKLPNDGPPGSCVVDSGGQFDLANKKYIATIGAYLSHGYQWNRSVYMRGDRLWIYDVDENMWTDVHPETLYNREAQGLDSNLLAKQNVSTAYADEHQVTYFFGGTGFAGSTNRLFYYDAYTNELVDTMAANPPSRRNHAGFAYDSKRDKLLMYGSQYRDVSLGGPPYAVDEKTWTYSVANNAWTSASLSPNPGGAGDSSDVNTYGAVPSMAYDSIHDFFVLTAYKQSVTDRNYGSMSTWKYDPNAAEWSEIATNEIDGTDDSGVRGKNLHFLPEDNIFLTGSFQSDDSGNNAENRIWALRAESGGTHEHRPPAPVITTDNSTCTISWGAVVGADSYKIYRATGSIPRTYTYLAETSDTSYFDAAVSPGTIYYYRYTSVDGGLESRQSFFARSQPEVMPVPIVSARSDYDVDIKWEGHPSSDIAGYNVYRGLCTVHTNTTIMETLKFEGGSNEFVVDETITQGGVSATIKYVTVESGSWSGNNASGYFSISNREGGNFSAGTVIGSDTGVASATGTQSKIVIDAKWYQTTYDGHLSPVVYMIRNVKDVTKLNTSLVTGTSFHDDDANLNIGVSSESADYPLKVYAYIIRAVNRFGVESGPSPYAITIPSAPKHVMFNTATETLRWDTALEDNVTGYNVYQYARTENGGLSPVNKLNSAPVSSPFTLPGESYHIFDRFWVVPVDSLGQEGVPSVPIWYGDRYSGFYSGDFHQ
jgi:hypothetical protein